MSTLTLFNFSVGPGGAEELTAFDEPCVKLLFLHISITYTGSEGNCNKC